MTDGASDFGLAVSAADSAKAAGMRIITIGLGGGVDDELLKAVASTEADFHFIADSSDLEDIYETISNSTCRFQNEAPTVFAGENIPRVEVGEAVPLNGIVSDDGLPTELALNILWSQLSGAGTAVFTDPASAATSVSFDAPRHLRPATGSGRRLQIFSRFAHCQRRHRLHCRCAGGNRGLVAV